MEDSALVSLIRCVKEVDKIIMRLAYNSLMSALAIYPRKLIVAMVGIVWLVCPLDIVPDSIPFFGMLDDAAIAILSAKSIMTSHKQEVLERSHDVA